MTTPAADGQPRYVLSIRPTDNTVVVGSRDRLDADVITTGPPVWTSGRNPGPTVECAVQLRAHGMTGRASVAVDDDGLTARLHEPQQGVAPGQALVMYDGDLVLGSATITAARRAVPA